MYESADNRGRLYGLPCRALTPDYSSDSGIYYLSNAGNGDAESVGNAYTGSTDSYMRTGTHSTMKGSTYSYNTARNHMT